MAMAVAMRPRPSSSAPAAERAQQLALAYQPERSQRPGPVASSLAVARTPCWDQRVAPARQQRMEESAWAATATPQNRNSSPVPVMVLLAAPHLPSRRRARSVPAESSPRVARTPCWDRPIASPWQQRAEEPAPALALAVAQRQLRPAEPAVALEAAERLTELARSSWRRSSPQAQRLPSPRRAWL